MEKNTEIAQRLRLFRVSSNLTLAELANAIGKSAGAVQRYENGERKIDKTSMKLLQYTHSLNYDWLYTGRGEMILSKEVHIIGSYIPVYDITSTEIKDINKIPVNSHRIMSVEYLKNELKVDPADVFIIVMKDNILTSLAEKGDTVLCTRNFMQCRPLNGAYVYYDNDKICIRRATFRKDVIILCDDSHYHEKVIPRDEFKAIGRIIQVCKVSL